MILLPDLVPFALWLLLNHEVVKVIIAITVVVVVRLRTLLRSFPTGYASFIAAYASFTAVSLVVFYVRLW